MVQRTRFALIQGEKHAKNARFSVFTRIAAVFPRGLALGPPSRSASGAGSALLRQSPVGNPRPLTRAALSRAALRAAPAPACAGLPPTAPGSGPRTSLALRFRRGLCTFAAIPCGNPRAALRAARPIPQTYSSAQRTCRSFPPPLAYPPALSPSPRGACPPRGNPPSVAGVGTHLAYIRSLIRAVSVPLIRPGSVLGSLLELP
jgi:hypothetical protein